MKRDNKDNLKVCSILLGDREQQFTLKRSSRRTVGIAIDKNGMVQVTCPYRTPESYVNQLLMKKGNWILDKLEYIESRIDKSNATKLFEEGEAFSYLGKTYILRLIQNNSLAKAIIKLEAENLIIQFSTFEKDKIKYSLKQWYVDQFKRVIEDRTSHFAEILGVYPQRITIREQKTRWGSCSAKGNINLNWKLIMAPPEVLDYVLVHELCHMRELNHSKKFWQLVENVDPQYKKHRTWLKENGDNLSIG